MQGNSRNVDDYRVQKQVAVVRMGNYCNIQARYAAYGSRYLDDEVVRVFSCKGRGRLRRMRFERRPHLAWKPSSFHRRRPLRPEAQQTPALSGCSGNSEIQVASPNEPESRCVALTMELCVVVGYAQRPGTIRPGPRSLKYQRRLIYEPLPEFKMLKAAMCINKNENSPSKTLTTGNRKLICGKCEANTREGLCIR